MFHSFVRCHSSKLKIISLLEREFTLPLLIVYCVATLFCVSRVYADDPIAQVSAGEQSHFVTTVAQFRALSGIDYRAGCDFRLKGIITFVDTTRNLVVLQDFSGAVALNFPFKNHVLKPGQLVVLEGTNCYPFFAGFPDFPFRFSGRDIRPSFEGPRNWGNYNLTRMRGYLHPKLSGAYTFWIASDNSSELWLSENSDPSKVRKIASIIRYGWVTPNDWSRYPSQHSESVFLKAGETYYIEALCEQTDGGNNLSVAWQGPEIDRAIIGPSYLTPWGTAEKQTSGILREYWTNYSAGDLDGLAIPRAFESALTVKTVKIAMVEQSAMPAPEPIDLNQSLRAGDNYKYVQVEGRVKFTGKKENESLLELSDGQATAEIRVPNLSPEMLQSLQNSAGRIEGVCEGAYDQKGTLVPGTIWVTSERNITPIPNSSSNPNVSNLKQAAPSPGGEYPAMQGFYGTRGVVTFNGNVFGRDYIFVQENSLPVQVNIKSPQLKAQFKVGEWVDLGGALEPGKHIPTIIPLVVKNLGQHMMPLALSQPSGLPISAHWEGKWSEIEGVVHSVNTNGTLSIMGKGGPTFFWIGQMESNSSKISVDAKLRARGVSLLTMLDKPVLLVPSPAFVDVEEAAARNPFRIPQRSIADILPEKMDSDWFHRVRVVGEITYRDAQSFFVQDASGGIRVLPLHPVALKEGETAEIVGFPSKSGFARALTGALIRPSQKHKRIRSKSLDLSDALSSDQSGTLVNVTATLLACKTNGIGQLLQLQEQQRVFVATLASGRGDLPSIAPGSRLHVTGICSDETTEPNLTSEKSSDKQTLPSLNIVLRNPTDVTVLNGPPWWTLKKIVTLVSTLSLMILVTLLWISLLRRRLERQQAAQLAFSRQVLERLEDERRRIAINLHDSLGQILLVIKNHALLAIQRQPETQNLHQRLDEISSAASQAIDEVRQITHGLRPYQLNRLGLAQAIRTSISQTTANSPISFATRVEDIDGVFDNDSEIHVYRIVQEAVTNIIKHSGATEATVVIKKRPSTISLSIRDNGRGFDPTKSSSQPHGFSYGLSGIAERVRILEGTLVIDSRPDSGTNLTIEVPLATFTNETRSNNNDRG
jgi:signal transduction histidine kinase